MENRNQRSQIVTSKTTFKGVERYGKSTATKKQRNRI
jgi:hypothetical protein